MNFDPKEIIEKLKMEAGVIEGRGYYPSVREPRQELRILRDSVSCPNMTLEEKQVPCSHCWLEQFIPAQHMDAEEPCHYIPLNDKGDTVASLLARGENQRAQSELLGWLRRQIAHLEEEVAAAPALPR